MQHFVDGWCHDTDAATAASELLLLLLLLLLLWLLLWLLRLLLPRLLLLRLLLRLRSRRPRRARHAWQTRRRLGRSRLLECVLRQWQDRRHRARCFLGAHLI